MNHDPLHICSTGHAAEAGCGVLIPLPSWREAGLPMDQYLCPICSAKGLVRVSANQISDIYVRYREMGNA